MARFIDASIYRNTFPAIRIVILFFTIVTRQKDEQTSNSKTSFKRSPENVHSSPFTDDRFTSKNLQMATFQMDTGQSGFATISYRPFTEVTHARKTNFEQTSNSKSSFKRAPENVRYLIESSANRAPLVNW